ncbi:MAG: FtsB family cell division protein [Acidimicrobiales bacterium]
MPRDPSPKPHPTRQHAPKTRRPLSRTARTAAWVATAIALVTVLFVFVFPTRTYFGQRRQLSLAAERVRVLDDQNKQLAAEAAKLQTPEEIQRLARAQYHMVKPGEKAYVILPAPLPPPTTTIAPPPVLHHTAMWRDVLTSWLP